MGSKRTRLMPRQSVPNSWRARLQFIFRASCRASLCFIPFTHCGTLSIKPTVFCITSSRSPKDCALVVDFRARFFSMNESEQASGPEYVTLVSNDGFEFKIQRSSALLSAAVARMLNPQSTCHRILSHLPR